MNIPFRNCEKGDFNQGGKYVSDNKHRFGEGALCLDL